MKLNAVGVTSNNFLKSIEFYTILGFEFPEYHPQDQHIEPKPTEGGVRLMIDSVELAKDILGEEPRHGNHASFAVEYDTPEEVDATAARLKEAGFTIIKEPWDAFWGQRYAVVADPCGYIVDLYAAQN